MKKIWRRLKTSRGIALAAILAVVLAGAAAVMLTAPWEVLASSGLLLPMVGLALAADRETQYKEGLGIKRYLVKTGVTIYKGGLVCVEPSGGYAVPGADTVNYRCVGVAEETVAAGSAASGTYGIRVRSGLFLLAATSITQAMVGSAMYVKDDQTFDDTSSNGVFAGILAEYVSTTSGWIWVFPGSVPLLSVTASAAEINKLDAINPTGYVVVMEEVTFTQTSGDGTYTGTIALPAGSQILDVAVHGIALWAGGTSASLVVGDGDSANGFFTATDLYATDLLAGEVNNIEHPGGKAGAYIGSEQRKLYSATARNVIGVVTQVGAGTAGRTRLVVTYANPTAAAAVKA